MKKSVIGVLCITLIIACAGFYRSMANNRSEEQTENHADDYDRFIADAIMLKPDNINRVNANDVLLVELPEIPSSGYLWHYRLPDPTGLTYVGEKIFNFNEPGVVGGTLKHLWKFKVSTPKPGKIILKKYREWLGEESTKEAYTYLIEMKSER